MKQQLITKLNMYNIRSLMSKCATKCPRFISR